MSRLKLTVALLACAALVATPAASQTSASISAVAAVVGVAPLTVTGVADLDFGTVPAGAPFTVADPATQAGRFNLTGEPSAAITMTYTLPTTLTFGTESIPISFGPADGLLWGPFPTAFTTFDPNVPFLPSLSGTGNLTVGIQGTVNPPPGTITGTYTGTITLTVAYL